MPSLLWGLAHQPLWIIHCKVFRIYRRDLNRIIKMNFPQSIKPLRVNLLKLKVKAGLSLIPRKLPAAPFKMKGNICITYSSFNQLTGNIFSCIFFKWFYWFGRYLFLFLKLNLYQFHVPVMILFPLYQGFLNSKNKWISVNIKVTAIVLILNLNHSIIIIRRKITFKVSMFLFWKN